MASTGIYIWADARVEPSPRCCFAGNACSGLVLPLLALASAFWITDAGLVHEVVRLSRNQFGVIQTLNGGWIANLMVGPPREWNWLRLGLGW